MLTSDSFEGCRLGEEGPAPNIKMFLRCSNRMVDAEEHAWSLESGYVASMMASGARGLSCASSGTAIRQTEGIRRTY